MMCVPWIVARAVRKGPKTLTEIRRAVCQSYLEAGRRTFPPEREIMSSVQALESRGVIKAVRSRHCEEASPRSLLVSCGWVVANG
jgi:hypothetical protein